MPSYRAPLWLPDGHSQTVWPALFLAGAVPQYRRELWPTPDGDEIALDFLVNDSASTHAPLVVLFHGLEGSSRSHYARALMREVACCGWQGVVVHFRGCGGQHFRAPRAYHAGDSAEIAWVLQHLARRFGCVLTVGVSLGGNALLKYLGEAGQRAIPHAAAAISAPLDLTAAGHALERSPINRQLYTRMFLRSLKPKSLRLLQHYPHLLDQHALRTSRTLRHFDHHVTAPLHGFDGVEDYWQRASSKPYLAHITIPTWVLNARNDPFLPAHALPKKQEVSAHVQLEFPKHGGHVGFVSGHFPGHIQWLPRRIVDFFTQQLS